MTLYKHLNSRAFGVLTKPTKTTVSSDAPPTCGLYIMDGVKGTIVYHIVLLGVARRMPVCNVRVSLMENWLVYHYYDEGAREETKGWRTVSMELYKGLVNQKTGRYVFFLFYCAK